MVPFEGSALPSSSPAEKGRKGAAKRSSRGLWYRVGPVAKQLQQIVATSSRPTSPRSPRSHSPSARADEHRSPIARAPPPRSPAPDRKSTRLNSSHQII